MSEKLTIEERANAIQRAVPTTETRRRALAHLRAVDAAARAEERERCARIAESESAPAGSHEEAYVSATVRRIATAIREGSDA